MRLGDWGVLGQMNLTVEAVVFGLVFAMRLLIVALACLQQSVPPTPTSC